MCCTLYLGISITLRVSQCWVLQNMPSAVSAEHLEIRSWTLEKANQSCAFWIQQALMALSSFEKALSSFSLGMAGGSRGSRILKRDANNGNQRAHCACATCSLTDIDPNHHAALSHSKELKESRGGSPQIYDWLEACSGSNERDRTQMYWSHGEVQIPKHNPFFGTAIPFSSCGLIHPRECRTCQWLLSPTLFSSE